MFSIFELACFRNAMKVDVCTVGDISCLLTSALQHFFRVFMLKGCR